VASTSGTVPILAGLAQLTSAESTFLHQALGPSVGASLFESAAAALSPADLAPAPSAAVSAATIASPAQLAMPENKVVVPPRETLAAAPARRALAARLVDATLATVDPPSQGAMPALAWA
jgi:hypothetical protein